MGDTTLLESVKARDIEAVTRLLDAGVPPDLGDQEGTTALSWAAGKGFAEIVSLLLERGANPELANKYGVLPIHHACNAGHVEAVKLLVDHGARFHSPQTGLHPLVGAASNGNLDVVRYLVEEKAVPPNDRAPSGGTPLHSAAVNGHQNVVEFLLQNGADPHAKNNHGETVISWVEASLKLSGLTPEQIATKQKILQLLKSASSNIK
jgi:ankyrin repeat protein